MEIEMALVLENEFKKRLLDEKESKRLKKTKQRQKLLQKNLLSKKKLFAKKLKQARKRVRKERENKFGISK